jgi:uncharacterized membrane protein
MALIAILKWIHIIGAAVLLGTGAGIAFFMFMANRTKNAALVAHTASIVVIADVVFTTTAVIIQPITGTILAYLIGWSLGEGWILLSISLYVVTGLCWLPVVWIQLKMRNLARVAQTTNTELPTTYYKLYNLWFILGFPAFVSVLAIFWLMVAKPQFQLFW